MRKKDKSSQALIKKYPRYFKMKNIDIDRSFRFYILKKNGECISVRDDGTTTYSSQNIVRSITDWCFSIYAEEILEEEAVLLV